MRHLLRRAVLRGNSLRTPFHQLIEQKCENLLTTRFEEILGHLEEAKETGWTCPAALDR